MARNLGGKISLVMERDGKVEEIDLKEMTFYPPKIEVYDECGPPFVSMGGRAYSFELVSYDLHMPRMVDEWLHQVWPTEVPYIAPPTIRPVVVWGILAFILLALTIIIGV